MSQQVTVHGPNIGQGGEFRVHRAGCADTKRGEYLVTEPPWSLNATSQQQVVEDIYSDIIPENPGSTWETYADTVRFYPCTDVPTTEPAATGYEWLDDPAERAFLTDVDPQEVLANAHRAYDWLRERGMAPDSVLREAAFAKAAEALGIDYDVLYDAWMSQAAAIEEVTV